MAILQCIDALSLILCSLPDYLSYYFFLHKLTFMLERVLASRSLTQLLQNFSTRWFIKLSISVPGCDRNILPFFSAAVQSLTSWFFPRPKYLKIEHLISFSCVGRYQEHKNLFWRRVRPLASDIKVLHLASINVCRLSGIVRNVPFAICINHDRTASICHTKRWAKKIAQKFWDHLSFHLSMLFQMVGSILLSVLPFKTNHLVNTDWLLNWTNQQPGLGCNTVSKSEHILFERADKRIVCVWCFLLIFCMTSSAALMSMALCPIIVSCTFPLCTIT